jgi:fermentation-respiration switch protein FrsA (DUF1100 family)
VRGILILIAFALASCLKLDSNLYNLGDKITEYRLDAYNGEQDFILDDSYKIPPAMLNLFVLSSKLPEEENAKTIHCLYIGDIAKIATDTVILYCHGNKWHMDFYWQRAKLLAHVNGKNRYGVLMMDYRGYGLSEGEPGEEGIYADVDACIAWLKEKGLTPERLMVYGFSLGSAPACELTATPRTMPPSKLILEAPFGSAAVMVQDASQLNMPATYFTDLEIDNAEEIKKVSQPLLWLHGLNDNFLSYKTHGEVVYKNHEGIYREKSLTEGADHGEVPEKMGFENYLEVVGRFIRKAP